MKHFGTNAIHAGHDPDQWNCKAVMPPIFMATTFKQHLPGIVILYIFFNFFIWEKGIY